jgi:hypothetical protein
VCIILLLLLLLVANPATAAPACPGSTAVAHFRLEALSSAASRPQPVERVNRLRAGDILRYIPADPARGQDLEKGRVALIAGGAGGETLYVLPVYTAAGTHEWMLPADAANIALAYGPNGFDEDKLRSVVNGDKDLLAQLSAYSEKSAQTETVLNALSGLRPRDDRSMEAALTGLAATTPGARVDRNAPMEQQTLALLRGINPALRTYDPLAPEPQQRLQQSATLAASVAGMFFGSTVGLAGGGAALFLNMRSVLFPKTELRSALLRSESGSALCAQTGAAARTRIAYLWARRLPGGAPPAIRLAGEPHAALGQPASLAVEGEDAALLAASRAQRWKLVDAGGAATAVKVSAPAGEKTLRIGEVPATLTPGAYALFAEWDWDEVRIGGVVHLDRIPDLSSVRLPAADADSLITQSGKRRVHLGNAPLRFLRSVHLLRTGDALARPAPVPFAVAASGDSVEMELDTGSFTPGAYLLQLEQIDGSRAEIPVAVHPPLPKLRGLPLEVAAGSAAAIRLEGEGLEHIEDVALPALAGGGSLRWERSSSTLHVALDRAQPPAASLELSLRIAGRQEPYVLPGALQILPPRARIAAVQPAGQEPGPVALRTGEIDASRAASFSLRVEDLTPSSRLEVRCRATAGPLPADSRPLGEGMLFLTLPATNRHGCELEVSLDGGAPETLGRTVLLPRIREFQLTSEPAGENRFAGFLHGTGLEMIEKTGWTADRAEAVTALPAPNGEGQKLSIVMPWPSPAPHAPLLIWLRGETEPRTTTVRY